MLALDENPQFIVFSWASINFGTADSDGIPGPDRLFMNWQRSRQPAFVKGQRSFNWQSIAFVMRRLWVQIPPLAL